MQSGVERNGRSGPHQNGNHASSQIPRFPNIKDLQDEAASLDVNESTPVRIALLLIRLEVSTVAYR
jgi:ubiquitin carboxyl-terminal hydrolase 8